MENLCPGTQTVDSVTCANAKGRVTWIWVNMGWDRDRAFTIWNNDGLLGTEIKNHSRAAVREEN